MGLEWGGSPIYGHSTVAKSKHFFQLGILSLSLFRLYLVWGIQFSDKQIWIQVGSKAEAAWCVLKIHWDWKKQYLYEAMGNSYVQQIVVKVKSSISVWKKYSFTLCSEAAGWPLQTRASTLAGNRKTTTLTTIPRGYFGISFFSSSQTHTHTKQPMFITHPDKLSS